MVFGPIVQSPFAKVFPAAASAAPAVVYILRDDFTTDDAAPIASPRTCEPGPGTLTFVQNDGAISIESSILKIAGQTTPAFGDQGYYSAAIARTAGRAYMMKYKTNNIGSALPLFLSDLSTMTTASVDSGILRASSTLSAYDPPMFIDTKFAVTTNVDYFIAIIQRLGGGAYYMIKLGEFTRWTLFWVGDNDVTANQRIVASWNTGATGIDYQDNLYIADVATPFTSDYALATQRLAGARSAGDTFTHEGDCILWFTLTTRPSAGNVDFRFRQQDANNYWQVTINSSGVVKLNEIVATTPTERGTYTGAVTGNKVRVICYKSRISISIANAHRINYAAAANFATETDGVLVDEGTGGSVSDLVSWPVTMSEANDNVIDAIIPAGVLPTGYNLRTATSSHPATYQTTPTYDGSGQTVHPSVIDFGVGSTWNGYRYWMAITPYPNSDANYERLSILASADGDAWEVPAVVTNPVINEKHTDPDLYYEAGIMYLIYRDGTGGATNGNIFVCESTDGFATHTTPVNVLASDVNSALSPSVIKVGSTYELYSINITPATHIVERRTASSIYGPWSAPATVINSTPNVSHQAWHMDVVYTGGIHVAAICAESGHGIYLAQSVNGGTTWEISPAYVLASAAGWDAILYRPTIVATATGFDMWYSGWPFPTETWHTGRTAIVAEKYV